MKTAKIIIEELENAIEREAQLDPTYDRLLRNRDAFEKKLTSLKRNCRA